MSRDIRSFFPVLSKKTGAAADSPKRTPPAKKSKPKKLIDSDDDDIISGTPELKLQKTPKKKLNVLSSDSEDGESRKKVSKSEKKRHVSESPKAKKTHKPNKKQVMELLSSSEDEFTDTKTCKNPEGPKKELKTAKIEDVFKNTPIKQSKVEPQKTPVEDKVVKEVKKPKTKSKNSKEAEKKVHSDAAFEKTLEDLDDDFFINNADELEKSVSEALQQAATKKETVPDLENQQNETARKRSRTDSADDYTPKKKKFEHTDSGIDPGQEAHEKKRYSAMLYQKYLNRGGPRHHGMKELPKGKKDCLKNVTFLRTGVLDSLDSEDFQKLITDHGGRVVQGVSKKVNYLVVGEDAGPAKIAKADSYGIPSISEDELLDLILKKSGMEPKYCKANNSSNSEDLGIEVDQETKSGTSDEDFKENKSTKTKIKPEKGKKDISGFKENKNTETQIEPEKEKKDISPKTNNEIKTAAKPEITKHLSEETKKSPDSSSNVKTSSFYSQPSTSKTPKTQTATETSGVEEDSCTLPLTERYKPQSLKAVIGQQGEKSNLYKLKHWLENWHKNQSPKVRKTLIRPSPWAKCDDGAYFKCALLSGPPGVGKTTSATLVAKDLGLDVVEFNASDTRSKRSLQEEVAQLLHNTTIAGFATGQAKITNNRVLLMDEVDGMAGNEDRGGIQELIQLIKNSSVPIVCMCNDRNHQKMRSLVNYCFDLRFTKPRLEQIRGAMMSICFKEKIDISAHALSEIITGTGCDVRQTLNHLAILGSTKDKITNEVAQKEAKASKKDTVMGPWEVCRTVFTKSEHKDMSVADKARLFFFDYSLGPLFIQENYMKVQPDGANKKQTLLKAALAAASLSTGDIIDSKIRRSNNWALLESQAFFSSVLPGHYMSGAFTSQINFPSWLGKNSKKSKFHRMLNEIQMHTRVSASASKMAIRLDYLVPLRNAILSPLQRKGLEGVDEAVSVMKDYDLLREDVDSLVELYSWASKENPMSKIETKVKTAFTRAYNKVLLPFAPTSAVAKKKAAATENSLLHGDEEVISDNENDDDISNNAMIKVKKKPAGKKTDNEPGTSKKTTTKKRGAKKTK